MPTHSSIRFSGRIRSRFGSFATSSDRTSPMSSILPADAGWERWLEERFAGYLLQDAHGAPRNAEEVGRALARLQGSASAWSTLAALAFLLDPEDGVEKLVVEEIPRWLKRV